MNFKKLVLSNFLLLLTFGLVITLNFVNKIVLSTGAASSTTLRVWMKNSDSTNWDIDGAATCIFWYGGSAPNIFPGDTTDGKSGQGTNAKWDSNNSLVYYDIPSDATNYIWVRGNGNCTADWNARSSTFSVTNGVNNKYWELTSKYNWNGQYASPSLNLTTFSPTPTKIVSDFAATIDTIAEVCTESAAQAAINYYNNTMSSFEQNQFSSLVVGIAPDTTTGLQRLEYLKMRYSIVTNIL